MFEPPPGCLSSLENISLMCSSWWCSLNSDHKNSCLLWTELSFWVTELSFSYDDIWHDVLVRFYVDRTGFWLTELDFGWQNWLFLFSKTELSFSSKFWARSVFFPYIKYETKTCFGSFYLFKKNQVGSGTRNFFSTKMA